MTKSDKMPFLTAQTTINDEKNSASKKLLFSIVVIFTINCWAKDFFHPPKLVYKKTSNFVQAIFATQTVNAVEVFGEDNSHNILDTILECEAPRSENCPSKNRFRNKGNNIRSPGNLVS